MSIIQYLFVFSRIWSRGPQIISFMFSASRRGGSSYQGCEAESTRMKINVGCEGKARGPGFKTRALERNHWTVTSEMKPWNLNLLFHAYSTLRLAPSIEDSIRSSKWYNCSFEIRWTKSNLKSRILQFNLKPVCSILVNWLRMNIIWCRFIKHEHYRINVKDLLHSLLICILMENHLMYIPYLG